APPSPISGRGPRRHRDPSRGGCLRPLAVRGCPRRWKAAAADAIMSPEEELDGYEPEPLGKRPAVLPLVQLVGEASGGPGAGGSLPSTPPPAEEEEDELFRQSLEIISRYREQATGAKDAKPLGGPAASSRKALETLRRVGDGVQRNHEMAFQGERGPRALCLVRDRWAPVGGNRDEPGLEGLSARFRNQHILAMSHCFRPPDSLGTALRSKAGKVWETSNTCHGFKDGFVEFFHVEDLEGGIRNVLLAFAGVAGVGAGLAYLIR
uniref:MCL1 protein n=1 Tax=Myotis lucifugus TaxID=59463 RepID=G1PZ39_MYOLU